MLAAGVAWIEAMLGVRMQPGGRHPTMATHNALLRLGDDAYLEVIAVDPDAPAPDRPRWFGLDDLTPDHPPRLATWVARVDDLDAVAETSLEPLGEILPMERGSFTWRITVPPDGRLPLDGLVPALVAWSGERPTVGLEDRGCRLVALEARHPDPDRLDRALRALALDDLTVVATAAGEAPRFMATIQTRGGLRRLGDAP